MAFSFIKLLSNSAFSLSKNRKPTERRSCSEISQLSFAKILQEQALVAYKNTQSDYIALELHFMK